MLTPSMGDCATPLIVMGAGSSGILLTSLDQAVAAFADTVHNHYEAASQFNKLEPRVSYTTTTCASVGFDRLALLCGRASFRAVVCMMHKAPLSAG